MSRKSDMECVASQCHLEDMETLKAKLKRTSLELENVRLCCAELEEEKKDFHKRLVNVIQLRQQQSQTIRAQTAVIRNLQGRTIQQSRELQEEKIKFRRLELLQVQKLTVLKTSIARRMALNVAKMKQNQIYMCKQYVDLKKHYDRLLAANVQESNSRYIKLVEQLKSTRIIKDLKIKQVENLRNVCRKIINRIPHVTRSLIMKSKVEQMGQGLENNFSAKRNLNDKNRGSMATVDENGENQRSENNEETQNRIRIYKALETNVSGTCDPGAESSRIVAPTGTESLQSSASDRGLHLDNASDI